MLHLGLASKVVMCGNCYGFYHSRFLGIHKMCLESCEPSVNVPLSHLSSFDGDMSDAFLKEVLYKLRDDEIGKICKSDHIIIIIGKRRNGQSGGGEKFGDDIN